MSAALHFFSGLGQGVMGGIERNRRIAREKKLDDREDEEYEYRRQERERVKNERLTLANAGAAATVDTADDVLKDDDGNDMPAAPQHRVVTGSTHERFATPEAAQAAAESANSSGGRTKRVAAALYGMGKPGEALQLENSARQGELAEVQLKNTKETLKREDVFREVTTQLARGGWAAVPGIYDRYEDGMGAQVIEDGKGGATLIQMKDGKEVGRKAFATVDDFVLTTVARMDPKLWVSENRLARQHKADTEHKGAVLSETTRHNQAVEGLAGQRNSIAASAERRAAAAAAPAAPSFDPLASFDTKKAQAVAFEQASKEAQEAAVSGKPMSAQQQAQRAQQIYQNTADAFATESAARERARVFRTAAAKAKTPEEVEQLRARAAQSGFTEQEMGTLDPRFAPKAAATAPPAAGKRPRLAAAAGMPVTDPIGDQPIGMLTPMADLEAAAAAGNKRAIEYLRRRAAAAASSQSAPRTAAESLVQ